MWQIFYYNETGLRKIRHFYFKNSAVLYFKWKSIYFLSKAFLWTTKNLYILKTRLYFISKEQQKHVYYAELNFIKQHKTYIFYKLYTVHTV